MNKQAVVKVATWFRKTTKEWIGEIEYQANGIKGVARYTGATENEARNAAFAALGLVLLETTLGLNE